MLQPELLTKVLSFFREHHIEYMITGSVVSSLQGEPRLTHDVDIVVQIDKSVIPLIIRTFTPPRYYVSESAIAEAIERKTMFNLIDTSENDKVDFWILTNEPFDFSRFQRRKQEEVFGQKMTISAPEDTIIAKLKWAEMSGGSEKQFTDALRVYELQFPKLDLPYIENWVQKLNLTHLWQRLKIEAQPISGYP